MANLEIVRQQLPEPDTMLADALNQRLGNIHNNKGWAFEAGDPESWRFSDRLLVPGGKLLDLGIADTRGSFHFAFMGMHVTGLDANPKAVEFTNKLAAAYGLPMEAALADIHTADLGVELYDTIVIGRLFLHYPSREDSIKVLDKAIRALKPGGHIWIREIGREDDRLDFLEEQAKHHLDGVEQVSEFCYRAPCTCSGEWRQDPMLFFGQTDLLQYFDMQGMKTIHSQTLPQFGAVNIQFGEDYPIEYRGYLTHGWVTVLAQRSPRENWQWHAEK